MPMFVFAGFPVKLEGMVIPVFAADEAQAIQEAQNSSNKKFHPIKWMDESGYMDENGEFFICQEIVHPTDMSTLTTRLGIGAYGSMDYPESHL